jgi:hypothetical protein
LIRSGLVVAAIRVVVPVMVSVPLAALDHKVRPAAVIYPNAFVIRAPTVAFPARRLAVLLGQPDTPVSIDRTIVPVSVVGGAGDRDRLSLPVGLNCKIRPATVIYPNTSVVITPTVAFLALGLATLLHHSHPPPNIQRTRMAGPVIG